MRRLLLLMTFGCTAIWAVEAIAQLPAGDLRLWLQADSLNLAEDAQVTQWIDSSPNGTIFAPRTTSEPDGPLGGFAVEEFPHLQTITLGDKTFKSVKFEREGDIFLAGNPAVDRSGSTDRLYQTNNRTPGSDPLVIADGTSMTSFTVFKPSVTVPNSLGFQAVWALRGNDASLLELGISGGNPNTVGRFNYVTYDATTSYVAAVGPGTSNQPADKWHILKQSITEMGANDLLSFASNHTENRLNPLVDLLPVTNGGMIVDRNDGINEDPAGMVEPFGIGGHAQDCCGEGETFAGNIAEIIIYARALTAQETDQVYSYLANKYLPIPEPATGALGLFGLLALGVLRSTRQEARRTRRP
jgi:hypothetical protein